VIGVDADPQLAPAAHLADGAFRVPRCNDPEFVDHVIEICKDRDARFTRFGRAPRARRTPQLWNVLRGDLSFAGPRPQLIRYLDRYTPEQACRHLVKPGITGWAQANGRNAISWEQKFALDTRYVDHWSLGLDFRILMLTVWRVLTGHGVSQEGHATMPEFMGAGSHQIENRP
jgi:sugar transferase EpsL